MNNPKMMTRTQLALGFVAFLVTSIPSYAVDGMILINQQKALTGSVTAGDAAGFPVTLSQPGSYRLSGNLTVPNQNTTAIEVTADDVTIDLNGFAILGPGVAGLGSGILASSRTNVVVLNGTVRGMGSRGVHLGNKARAENLRLISNSDGIEVGVDSLVQEITALNNRIGGIVVFASSSVLSSISSQNGEDGIRAGSRCLVLGNTILNNGRYGALMESDSTILQNTISDNGDFGLLLGTRTGYAQNVITENATFTGPQVSGGLQMGTNVCGSDTICP